MPENSFANLIATLLTNGFNIQKVDRSPNSNNIIHTYKYDKLGARINYSILFTEDKQENAITETLLSVSEKYKSTPLIVSDNLTCTKCKTFTNAKFFSFFGGIINTGLILIPNLSEILDELGHNKLPIGLDGKPPDLHEVYVAECLQFIMESPTRRYGIDRSFESLPDGVVLSKEGFMLLLDSKSYKNGFDFQADDIKRFTSYIEDFRQRYPFFGSVLSFVVISGHFNDSNKAITGRSEELYKESNCKLSCITSKELGLITQLLKENPQHRSTIRWKNIFSNLIIDTKLIQTEITRIKKDNLA